MHDTLTTPRVLVTGALGFVGRHLVTSLQADGVKTDTLDRPGTGAQHSLELGSGDPSAMTDLLQAGCYDAVYHLAGQSSAGASFQDPAGTVRGNLLGTLEILEAARHLADSDRPIPRLLLVGSAEEYGAATPADRPCREGDPVMPISPYGTSKAAATQLACQYHQRFDLPVIPVRAFSHTGPGQDERFVFPAFAAQIAAIEAGRQEPVIRTGNLNPERDYLDVRDVVTAYRALVDQAKAGQIYQVCSGSALTIGQGLEILLGLSGAQVEVVPDPLRMRPADIPRLVGDPGRLKADTGWQPRHLFTDTLRDLLEVARQTLSA